MTAEIDRLLKRLGDAGAIASAPIDDGPFRELTYAVDDLVFCLIGEYGNWRVNIGEVGGPRLPASFWLAALDGHDTFPDPPVTEEDVGRVADVVLELVRLAPALAPQVYRMGEQYSRSMRERFQ